MMKKLVPSKALLIVAVLAFALVAVACGSEAGDGTSGDTDSGSMGAHGGGMISGEPADASTADREIEVAASDELSFDPQSVELAVGDVVTFVITNNGKTDHEFVLGDEGYQEQHEQGMEHGSGGMGMANAVEVPPGETVELTWRFDETGEVLYGCHEPGHYEGGMVGTITVS